MVETVDTPFPTGARDEGNGPQNSELPFEGSLKLRPFAKHTPFRKRFWPWQLERITQLWRRGWNAEIISCFLACLSLGGLTMTLLTHQSKPLPEWPQGITLNSIVSLFSILMRTSVGLVLAEGISQSKWQWFRKPRRLEDMEQFDCASRSAWGSVLLLCGFGRKRPYWIAALGALITVLAALLGFFTQQLVQFHDCVRKDPTATVGVWKTNNYSFVEPGGMRIFREISPIQDAIYEGLFQRQEGTASSLIERCTTGNCTFPSENGASFSTVALSHRCENVTSQVYEIIDDRRTIRAVWNISSNQSLELELRDARWAFQSAYVKGEILFGTLYTPSPYHAVRCTLFPSVKTFGTKITSSVIQETLVHVAPMGAAYSFNDWKFGASLGTNQTFRNGRQHRCQRFEEDGPGLTRIAESSLDGMPTHDPADYLNPERYWYLPTDCVWSVNANLANHIEETMSPLFESQEFETSPSLQQFVRGGNITFEKVDKVFENIATSITNTMRRNGEEGPSWQLRGDMWYTTTCVRISWPWIAVPAAMIFLSIVFLGLVSYESRDVASDRLWKSSVLATLFCELEHDSTKVVEPVGKQTMRLCADSSNASLDKDRLTYRIIRRDSY